MSLTGQATSSTSNFQLIIDALADYTKDTGIGLSKNPFAAALERSNSPEALLQLLQDRAGRRPSKNIATGNRSLINCLSPAVNVLHAFTGILDDVASLVGHPFHLVYHFIETSSGSLSPNQMHCLLGSMSSLLYALEYAVRPLRLLKLWRFIRRSHSPQ
jgi:hypothetical protein